MATTANLVLDATLSKAAYSSNNRSDTPVIDGWKPIALQWDKDFTPPDTFGAQLYKGPDAQYKVVFRGTEGNLADWAANDAYLGSLMHPEWAATTRFTAMALNFIRVDAVTNLAGARNALSVTGHSQGGFEAELAARIYGLKGSALDGMGAVGVFETNKAFLVQYAAAEGIDVEPDGYVLTDFKARVYTLAGRLGLHVSGVDVEYSPLYNGLGLLAWSQGGPVGGLLFMGMVHGIDTLLEIERVRAGNTFMRHITELDATPVLTDTTRVAVNALWGGEQRWALLGDGASLPPGYLDTFVAVQDHVSQMGAGARVHVSPGESIYIESLDGHRGVLIRMDGSGLSWVQTGALTETRVMGTGGSVQATLHAQQYDDGSALVETSRADGVVQRQTFVPDAVGRLLPMQTTLMHVNEAGEALQRDYDAAGELMSQTHTRPTAAGGTEVRVLVADGSSRTTVFNAAGEVTSVREVSALDALITQQTLVINDVTSLINAIKSGQALPILSSGLRLANTFDALDGATLPGLNATAQVVGGMASLYNLANALEHGDEIDQLGATVNALVQVNAALQATGLGSQALDRFVQTTGLGEALPYINAVVALKNGDHAGVAVAVASIHAPVIGWAYAVYSLISALGDEPPEAWGIARPVFQDGALHGSQGPLLTRVSVAVEGDSFGIQRAEGGLQTALDFLQQQVDKANADAGREAYGLIPQRMPSLTWHEGRLTDPGYAITDVDPITGEQRYPFLRWDDDGYAFSAYPELYEVDPLDPNTRAGFLERLVIGSLERRAVAPLWEVQTARMQQHAGDPYAGLSELERAGRSGRLAPVDPATGERRVGQFRPVVLDLDHSGHLPLVGKDAPDNGVAFDWDDSGYLKQTAWLGQGDGFLFIDRNANGRVDSGSELFSHGSVGDSFKGMRSMAWVDADADGRLTSVDPVFNQLKIWRDLNGDGDNEQRLADGTVVEDDNEIHTLAQVGITRLDYAQGRFSQEGGEYAMASPEFVADPQGTRVNRVQGGIFIEDSDGSSRLVVTQVVSAIDGTDTVQAFEDGAVSAGESRRTPRSIDLPHALLLANDSVSPAGLVIAAVMNAAHGTVALGQGAQTGFVVFTPAPDFHGEAGFQYVATDSTGYQRTFDVAIELAPVNDDPVVTSVESPGRLVYGYRSLDYAHIQYVSNGEDTLAVPVSGTARGDPIYQPYVETVPGSPIYGPAYVVVNGEEHHWTRDIVGHSPVTHVNRDEPIAIERATTGRLLASDVDGSTGFTYRKLTDGQYGRVTLSLDGAWSYEAYRPNGVAVGDVTGDRRPDFVNPDLGTVFPSNPGNGYLANRYGGDEVSASFLDSFTVRVSDDNGGVTDQTVTVMHHGPRPLAQVQSGSKKPIAIDLDGDGFDFIDVDDSNVFFDVNGDGWRRRTSWIGPRDGLLAIDRDGDGQISSGQEIAFVGDKNGAQTDLQGLAAFDTHADGRLTAADRDWARFGVWQDANTNGVTDAGEFRSLVDIGIVEIGLDSDGQFRVINGQSVHGLGTATLADGRSLQVADVGLRWRNEVQTSHSDGKRDTVTAANQPVGQAFQGTPDHDLVLGTAGSDRFITGAGDDVVMDDVGDDLIDAGEGRDLVYTGEGNDVLLLGDGDDAAYTGVGDDLVLGDGVDGIGHDMVLLEGGNDIAFGGGGNDFMAGGDGNDFISGDAGHDRLFGEAGRDALFGGDGDDELRGMDGDDLLMGGGGNDWLLGGAGDDMMQGGDGDDTYQVDALGDVVMEEADGGQDTVHASMDHTLGEHLEHLTLTGNADLQGRGNASANLLVGNGANNVLHGLAGDDTLDGVLGADTMHGGSGDDTFVVDDAADTVIEAVDAGLDTVRSRVSFVLPEHVENLALIGMASIDGTGNALANHLVGNDAPNLLDGGAGADTMAAGQGDDGYVVEVAGDTAHEEANQGFDRVWAHIDYALPAHVEQLTLQGSARRGTGNQLDNLLFGNDLANVLDGLAGADRMVGGAGDDRYGVDDTSDVVTEQAQGGIDLVLSAVSFALPDHAEHIVLTGTAHTDATGNRQANVLVGNGGANTLFADEGDDVLAGGRGDDLLDGGAGNDLYLYHQGEGRDVIRDHQGIDTLRLGEGITLSSVALRPMQTGCEERWFLSVLGEDGQESEEGIEFVVKADGSMPFEWIEFADGHRVSAGQLMVTSRVLHGSSRADTLVGDRRDDTVHAGSGADTVHGGTGHDTVHGGAHDDLLMGDGGNDRLFGESGDDRLWGGAGHDLLDGDSGEDRLFGGTGNDTLRGGAGSDLLVAGQGDDRVEAGSGEDVIVFERGDGADTVVMSGGQGDTLLLGGGIQRTDIALRKSGNDLVLDLGAADSLTFEDWYGKRSRRDIKTLHLVSASDVSGPHYGAAHRQHKPAVPAFDFERLVARFDAAREAHPGMQSWSAVADLTTATALVNPWAALQAATSLMADASQGLPSPITVAAPPSAEALAFVALQAGGFRPAWLTSSPASLQA